MNLGIKVIRKNGDILCQKEGKYQVCLVNDNTYQEGDRILFSCSEKNCFVHIQVDDALGDALVYIMENEIVYEIPFGEKKESYSPKSFYGDRHYLSMCTAKETEIEAYRNIAYNVMDQHGDTHVYPHASANVETRGESVFAARNAIDGVLANHSHGSWPYQSWGINRQDDAQMKLEFGCPMVIDCIVLYTRADFPHDNWWKEVTFAFSDGSSIEFSMEKSDAGHLLQFEPKTVSWLTLGKLIKADDPSPFPALTQIEVYGKPEAVMMP